MDFLTIKDAAQKAAKSSSSIRRVIYPIVKDDTHPDRHHVQPSPEDARALRLRGENFPWRISAELLEREVLSKQTATAERTSPGAGESGTFHEVIALLRDQLQQSQQQLQVKDQQIATLSEITKSLNERVREGNILVATLHKQLSVATPVEKEQPRDEPKVDKPSPAAKEQGTKTASKKVKPKKSLWGRMFG